MNALRIVRGRDGALDEGEVVGALDLGARRLGEVGDLDRAGDGEQLVLAVEQARAGSRRTRRTSRRRASACVAAALTAPAPPSAAPSRRSGRPARHGRSSAGPSWQWPQMADAAVHVALHREVNALGGDAAIEQRPGREAHHDLRAAHERDRHGGSKAARGDQPRARRRRGRASRRRALSTVTSTSTSKRPRQSSSSWRKSRSPGVRAPTGGRTSRSRRDGRARGRSPAAAARGRCRRPRSRGRRHVPPRAARRCRTDRGRRARRRARSAQSARVTGADGADRVHELAAGLRRSPLVEIGTSPTPNA